ncbi:hypothetical protein TNCT_403311 [Trichonephila clavata]|uniref:Uncharacterized protein n=1 Tax=Trichonephila clavata TaxID=2740835 RepID=A0A8X6LUN2_TRICU|nr:hypothetical protein TNCT_403311 [Trichonephila clavata]
MTRRLRPLVGHPYSFRERYREKSIVLLSCHVDFFPAVQHTPCPLDYKAFKPVNGPPKTFQEQIPLKETVPGRHSKSLY